MPPECEGSPGAVACRARDGRIDSRQLHPASNSLDELLPPALRVVIRHALPTLAAALCAALGACGPGRVPAGHEGAGYLCAGTGSWVRARESASATWTATG